MGSNMIIAIVVGAILVIVGFSLWPVLNGATNSLFSYFRDSCDDGNGNRFTKAYTGNTAIEADDPLPGTLDPNTYYVNHRIHGGAGEVITAGANGTCTSGGGGGSTVTRSDLTAAGTSLTMRTGAYQPSLHSGGTY